MKLNEHTALIGDRVVLVPYRREHVPTYHQWMQSPELRELTASEELSLEEEYDMQRKWQEDEDKLTFIVLARPTDTALDNSPTPALLRALPMIGDVNLFFKGRPGDDAEDFEAELEVMIAEPAYRRQGLAQCALEMLLAYATARALGPAEAMPFPLVASHFVARIGASNAASIALFERLGFEIVRHVEVFDEVEMRVRAEASEREWVGGMRVAVD
ncbi:hypothetical protein EWM64_g4903 [Hericium alpestre]|uniref:N-acetyltransferase domain-containing protein n=1 Tax=Hericium alpestre TaxID=135208 RepID=A0A4Y9ZYI7_9AGAM|nr:hypothetical protein EWM64_g4903 [Hericium alpestre]